MPLTHHPSGGKHPDHPAAPHAPPPEQPPHYATAYLRRLLASRKDWDPFPFMEVVIPQIGTPAYRAPVVPPAQLPGQATMTVTSTYGLIWDKMPFIGWDISYPDGVANFADLSSDCFATLWSQGFPPHQINQTLGFLTTDSVHGSPADDWVLHPGGIYLKQTAHGAWEQWQEQLNLAATPSGGNSLNGYPYLFAGLRGYRLYRKGSIQPVQKTREEYLEEGHRLEPFDYTALVTATFVPSLSASLGAAYVNTPGPTGSYQLNFNSPKANGADFLCNRIRIRPVGAPSNTFPFLDCIGVGLQMSAAPALNLQGTSGLRNFANQPNVLFPWRMALGADYNVGNNSGLPPFVQQLRSQWELPIGLTIPYNARWNMLAQALVSLVNGANPVNVQMEFCLEGELILPKG